ncbi:hypothetical protein Q73A0000_10020 [Kaistella flava (ex Peng et al. 2021)]|uniref:Lipoprotein n=1 Tax=Kaistella flava (ex Peng et al. 2021) TaxID=2038776 RepID=A0A7M2Y9C4_9FLAO|nr:hypothetical protein [Kaistella flava (ex Peng et al. 2021)]QOW10686.1 hypothetical protein Q73A0000_10020 [Kaistella flava (ex Peng et al. 2021)]
MKQINFLALSFASMLLITLFSCREKKETFYVNTEKDTLKKKLMRGATVTEKDSAIVILNTENIEEDPKVKPPIKKGN